MALTDEARALASALLHPWPAVVEDRASARRARAVLLTRLRREILPDLTGEDALGLLLSIDDRPEGGGGGGGEVEGLRPADPIVPSVLLSVVGDDDGLSTEGHRESGVEILRELFRRAFVVGGAIATSDGDEQVLRGGGGRDSTDNNRNRALIESFRRCSLTFRKRMARNDFQYNSPEKDCFGRHGTATEPAEPSEHMRMSLVELVSDLVGFILSSSPGNEFTSSRSCGETKKGKIVIEAASDACETLAKSALVDPCPEVQRAACGLAELLARMCPLAARMNAARLLLPLTGRRADGGSGEQLASSMMSKRCLFRHRHAKTRSAAVNASVVILLCCPREGGENVDVCENNGNGNINGHNDHDNGISKETTEAAKAGNISGYGSVSASAEWMLRDVLLPGWEDLLRTDPSASVRIAVMNSLGRVAAGVLDWGYHSSSASASVLPTVVSASDSADVDDGAHGASNGPANDLASLVEARVLSLFVIGMSVGNATQVRSMSVRLFHDLPGGGGNDAKSKRDMPWDVLKAYFRPTLELVLAACLRDWEPRQSKVRSLEALQVLLALSLENGSLAVAPSPSTRVPKVELSNAVIDSIVNVLSTNILSEEKEVLGPALVCCRILGGNDRCSKAVVEISSMQTYNVGDTELTQDADPVKDQQSSPSPLAAVELSPRQVTATLLLLDGLMKGYLCNEEAANILHEIDREMSIPTPRWFHSSPFSATAISSLLCHPKITNEAVTNSSLAWALLDACGSFVRCACPVGDCEKWELPEEVILDILVVIICLLGCPSDYGISSHAMSMLDAFSSSQSPGEDPPLVDIHFRRLLPRIASPAPSFPWRQSDPAFLAMDALLRACSGSTVGRNFDIVAPFFISHLSTPAYSKSEDHVDGAHGPELKDIATKDELAEDYSMRISLMALLQTILSDGSLSQALIPGKVELTTPVNTFSAQFTTDVLLSLVLPNLVWKAGGMASALRKLSAATLFSFLSNYNTQQKQVQQQEQSNGKAVMLLHPEMIAHLIPILHSNLEDTESTTRELSCICLSLLLEQISAKTFHMIWKTNTRVFDTLYPRLLELLDDSHDPVRMAACKTLGEFLTLAHSTALDSSFDLGLSSIQNIVSSLLIHLDDPDHEIQELVHQVLVLLVELQYQDHNVTKMREKNKAVVTMMECQINAALKSHRDGAYCQSLLEKVQKYHDRL